MRQSILLSVVVLAGSAAVAAEFEIIDTHTHFYDPSRKEGVPWPGKDDKVLYRQVLPDEFAKLTGSLGVVGTVVVEASPRVEDNQWLLDLAAKEPFIVGVVGRLDPASDDFEKNLRRFAANPLFRGIRINHDEVKAGLKGTLVERCKLMEELGLTLDVNGGHGMPADVAILAAKLPKLRIVINHAANLRIDGKEPPAKWREGMTAAAKCPNVFCKVSALVEQTAEKPAPRDVKYYRPVLDVLWTLFGEDRVLFGSNWPVSSRAAPYDAVLDIVRSYFTGKSERAAAKFFFDNSRTAYRWQPRPLTNSLGMTLVRIPPGKFRMGSPDSEPGREKNENQRDVELTKAFYLGTHEVTVGQFKKFVEAAKYQTEAEKDGKGSWGPDEVGKFVMDPKFTWKNPGFEQTDDHPVVNVSWNDAKAFCQWLSEKEKRTYRLPTEAEWEFACRAGSKTAFAHGDDSEGLATAGNVADATARATFPSWTLGIKPKDGHAFTAPVGQFKKNAFGLHDLHGNVWEWCEDWYDPKGYTTDTVKDPTGPLAGSARVQRGGGWSSAPHRARSASRVGRDPSSYRGAYLGFRIALWPDNR
jgi:L-fuconolactonase